MAMNPKMHIITTLLAICATPCGCDSVNSLRPAQIEYPLTGESVKVTSQAGGGISEQEAYEIGVEASFDKSDGMYSCKFAIKLPRKRKSLTVQGDFGKIIDVGRTKSCLLGV